MKRSAGLGLSVALVVTSLVACAPGGGSGSECTGDSSACSLSDVDPEVLTRMIDLGEEAYEYSQEPGVTWGDVGHFLDDQDDVVDVTLTPVEISFQVEGAPPSYLLSELSGPSGEPDPSAAQSAWPDRTESGEIEAPDWFPEDRDRAGEVAGGNHPAPESAAASQSVASRPVVHTAAWSPTSGAAALPATVPAQQPVGEPGAGHDRHPKKRALVLEPYGPMGSNPVGADLAAELSATGQYDVEYYGDLHWSSGARSILDILQNLDRYDLVYVTSHGSASGWSSANARDWYVENPETGYYNIADELHIPPGIVTARGPDGKMRFFVRTEFFEHQYPQGLTDTLFFGNWCQSAKDGTFESAVLGSGSVYLGWTESVGIEHAARAARYFWEGAVDWHVDSTAAYDNVVEHGAHYQPPVNPVAQGVKCVRGNAREGRFTCPEWYDSTLEIFTAGNALHVVDTVTSFQGDARIKAGTSLAWSGDVDDGQSDTLDEILVIVRGIDPQDAAKGHVEIVIDGEPVEKKIAVEEMEITATDGVHWEEREALLTDVELPFDVSEEQTEEQVPWEVRLVGPDGGVSVHEVDGVRLEGEEPEVLVVHPELFHEMSDGERLEAEGTEGDGEPGSTAIAVLVDDVGPERAGEYYVTVTVTGGTLDDEWFFMWDLTELRDLGDNQWRKQQAFDLDRDLTDGNRPLLVDARLFHDDEIDAISTHAPTVMLHARPEAVCSAQLNITGELTHHSKTYGVSYSSAARPAWSTTLPAPSLRFYAPEGSGGFATLTGIGYTFGVETGGIERGATGTFSVPAKILWSSWEIDPRTGTNLAVYGDLTLTITEHTTGTEVWDADAQYTALVRGTLSGTMTSDPGPDDTGSLSVDASFAFSRAGCYPGAGG